MQHFIKKNNMGSVVMKHEEFIRKIEEKFNGDIICLDIFVSYRHSKKMRFKCIRHKDHDEVFIYSAENILRTKGSGCPFCDKRRKTATMIQKELDIKSKGKVKLISDWNHVKNTVYDKLEFVCSEHGEYTDCLNNVLGSYKHGCSKCAYSKSNSVKKERTVVKINKLLKNSHITLKEETYKGVNKIALFTCKEHGDFKRRPGKVLYSGSCTCPKCGMSNIEKFVLDILISLKVEVEQQKKYPDLKDKRYLKYDFYLPKFNTLIEVDGKQHYDESSLYFDEEQVRRDLMKNEYANKKNIPLIRIQITDLKNIKTKSKLLKEIMLELLNERSTTSRKTYTQVSGSGGQIIVKL